MKYTYTILLLSIFTILSAESCKKENNDSFYFKCKVNGQEYYPDRCANCEVAKLLGDSTIIINGNRGFESILIGVIKLDHVPLINTNYVLNQRPEQKASYKNSTTTTDVYFTDSTRTGILNITEIDKTNKIIKGDFYFKAYNAFRNNEINITDGSFRLNYTTY